MLTFNYIYFEIWNKIKALINNDESFFKKHFSSILTAHMKQTQ